VALDPLATKSDLDKRGVDIDSDAATPALAAASAAVRDAAGCAISSVTSTVTMDAVTGCWLQLPGGPVTAVTEVLIGSTDVTDDVSLRFGGRLYLDSGWYEGTYPGDEITVTYTHGFAEVPADIVDLVCALAAASIKAAADDYAAQTNVSAEREQIGEYTHSVDYVDGSATQAPVVELPERTRRSLAARFGGGAYVV
jgi:hypothetical protein